MCFNAGKTEAEYTSHYLRDQPGPCGVVVCPYLLSLECRYCKGKGHTPSRCPVLEEKRSAEKSSSKNLNEWVTATGKKKEKFEERKATTYVPPVHNFAPPAKKEVDNNPFASLEKVETPVTPKDNFPALAVVAPAPVSTPQQSWSQRLMASAELKEEVKKPVPVKELKHHCTLITAQVAPVAPVAPVVSAVKDDGEHAAFTENFNVLKKRWGGEWGPEIDEFMDHTFKYVNKLKTERDEEIQKAERERKETKELLDSDNVEVLFKGEPYNLCADIKKKVHPTPYPSSWTVTPTPTPPPPPPTWDFKPISSWANDEDDEDENLDIWEQCNGSM
jgi:hypothetical protein